MTTTGLTRSWPPLAAWGAGLIQLALGAGMISGTAGPRGISGQDAGGSVTWIQVSGILLFLTGAAALVWGTVRMSGRSADRFGLVIAVVGIVACAGALIVDPARTSIIAVTVAVALGAVVGVIVGRSRRPRARRAPSPRAVVAGVFIGAIAVAGVVTPALSSTEAGRLAPDHGQHQFDLHGH